MVYPCAYVLLYLYIYTSILLCFYASIILYLEIRTQGTGHMAKGIVMHHYTHILIIIYLCNSIIM